MTVARWTLLVAALMTLTGVGGELSALVVLAHLSTATSFERVAVYVALGLTGLIIGLYAIFTTRQLVNSQEAGANARSGLSGPGGASLTL